MNKSPCFSFLLSKDWRKKQKKQQHTHLFYTTNVLCFLKLHTNTVHSLNISTSKYLHLYIKIFIIFSGCLRTEAPHTGSLNRTCVCVWRHIASRLLMLMHSDLVPALWYHHFSTFFLSSVWGMYFVFLCCIPRRKYTVYASSRNHASWVKAKFFFLVITEPGSKRNLSPCSVWCERRILYEGRRNCFPFSKPLCLSTGP